MLESRMFTEDHKIFRSTLRRFIENELAPHHNEWEKEKIFPRWVFEKMGEMGYLGIRYPEELGGSNLDYWYSVIFAEELPRCNMAGLAMSILVQTDMTTPMINKIATQEQKEEFLVPAIKGEKIAALAVTEPGGGSDVAAIRTRARKDGDDYIINGSKTFITNGTRADFLVLATRTGESGSGFGGISVFLFPTDIEGYSVSRKLDKIGNHSSDTAELAFDDCRIPARYLLGQENQGFYYIMQNFAVERLVAAITVTSGAQICLEDTIQYCRERQAFGRPIIKFQVNRHKIVEMMTELEAGRQLSYHAADLYNNGKECTKEVAMAKLFTSEVANRVADQCLQLHGGYGYMDEYLVSRVWRDTRLVTIGAGTSEIMKEIIARFSGIA